MLVEVFDSFRHVPPVLLVPLIANSLNPGSDVELFVANKHSKVRFRPLDRVHIQYSGLRDRNLKELLEVRLNYEIRSRFKSIKVRFENGGFVCLIGRLKQRLD